MPNETVLECCGKAESECRDDKCPLCGEFSPDGEPHDYCVDYEQYMADQYDREQEERIVPEVK